MLKTILVPLDGSALSEKAVPFARGLARPAGAKILLMRAVQRARPDMPEASRVDEGAQDLAADELETVARFIREADIRADYFLWNAEAGQAITEAAREQGADLIVMSTHGRTGIGRALYGSTADFVLRNATVPILLVSPGARYSFATPYRFVVALDGSPLAEEALTPAIALAEAVGGELILVRAVEPHSYVATGLQREDAPERVESELDAARRYLDAKAEGSVPPGIAITGYAAIGQAGDVILEAGRINNVSAIVLATHGRSGLPRLVMGSIAEDLLRRTTIPLLIIRPTHMHIDREQATPAVRGEPVTRGRIVGEATG
jgi:nucleotide-binding universal stress UspA family protein